MGEINVISVFQNNILIYIYRDLKDLLPQNVKCGRNGFLH